jgi:hypothetical protein
MNLTAFIIGFCLIAAQTKTANYIGMSKDEIVKVMNETNPGFDLDDGTVNNTYKYLKYVDKNNEETWLFFLSDKDICTHMKLMSDYSNLEIRKNELDKEFKPAGENKWIFINKGTVYIVEMKKEEWFFTVTTKRKE